VSTKEEKQVTDINTSRWLVPPASIATIEVSDPAIVELMRSTAGFFPNSYRIMARNPELTRAMRELALVVVYSGKVDIALKWLVGHVASRAAGCRYCAAHTANGVAKRSEADEAKVDAVWDFERSPLFDGAERAALSLALAAGASPNVSTPAHFEALREYFSDEEILEIVAVIAFYGFWNRWNDTLDTPLEDQPLAFGLKHLQGSGWDPGKHGH
jgi:uncharacterized peroxidase-related enzyme